VLARDRIALYAHIADIKQDLCENLLVMSALLALLQEKGLISPDELQGKLAALDRAAGDGTA